MKDLILLMLFALTGINAYFMYTSYDLVQKNHNLVLERDYYKDATERLQDSLNARDTLLKHSFNFVKRMEHLAGVKHLDGTITFKEKLMLPNKAVHNMNNADLR